MSKVTELQKVKVCIDTIDTPSKPTPEEISLQKQKLANSSTEISVEYLAKLLVTHHSRMWVPAEFDGILSNDTWKSQQVIALNFQKKIKLEGVLERLKKYNLTCNLIYSKLSLSSTSKNFTVVFVLKEILTNRDIRDHVMRACMMLFPEADMSCKETTRVFAGGKKIIHQNYDYRVDLVHLVTSGELHYLGGASKNTLTKRLKELGEKCDSIIYYIGSQKNPKFDDIRYFDFNVAAQAVKILDDLIKGQALTQYQLLGVCTNALHVTGGLKFVKEVMDRVGKYPKNYYNILAYVKWCGFYPMELRGFSPYKEDHIYRNIIYAVKIPKGAVRKVEIITAISLQAGEQQLRSTMEQIKKSNDMKIHVLCAPTGLGKTELILDWEKVLIAFPDHTLKEEVVSRMRVDHAFTPNIQDYLSEDDDPFVKHCYAVGAIKKASAYIISKKRGSSSYRISEQENKYEEYSKALAQSSVSDKTVLTTHLKVQYTTIKHDEIIFDEDPFSSLFIQIQTALVNDIENIRKSIKDKSDKKVLSNILSQVVNSPYDVVLELRGNEFKDFDWIESAAAQNYSIRSNVIGFLASKFFLIDKADQNKLYFIKKYLPPADKKVIILSATADKWIYKKLFGDRLQFYDLGPVELQGKLLQDTSFPFSRQNLNREDVFMYASQQARGRKKITFLSFRDKFDNTYVDLYYGFCQGRDGCNDNQIAVIGTPHLNPVMYKLYAKGLNLDLEPDDFKMKTQQVNRNGFCFPFYTSKNEILQNLQFYLIERDLRQAIGRARLIRRPDANVLVLSNYPLPEAIQRNEM